MVQLTKHQHIVPSKSISRFCDPSGFVWVKHRQKQSIFPSKPRNRGVFCVKRAWEERSENGHKKNIEDAYQEIADAICSGELTTLNQDQSDSVS